MVDGVDQGGKRQLENDIAPFRGPMVTSVGLILGFMLGFLATWAAQATDEAPAVETQSDWLIFVTLAVSILLLVIVLYRQLDNTVHPQPGERHRVTLRLYMSGITIAFAGLAAALLI